MSGKDEGLEVKAERGSVSRPGIRSRSGSQSRGPGRAES